jgi:phosphohistidine swiveling domain-containing protein
MKQKINNFSFEPKRKNVRPPCVSDEIKYWARCVGEIAYLNEFRKAYFTQAAVFARPVLDIIAKNNGLGSWHEINLLTDSEILDLLRGKNREQKKIIEHRKNNKIAFYNTNKGEIAFLNKKDLQKFIKLFGTYGGNDGLVSGMIANKGIVRGHAKIILTPNDFQKFKQGDILIADMTSTDFIPIMKKAAAFVTDEGGLACHAAIVSREYGKPCVIGTKIATKVFRDGDFVEVDADKGNVIKIL